MRPRAADPGIAAVAPPEVRGGVATLLAYPTTAPQDDATYATIQRLRATVDAHVGGNTADWADIGDRLEQRLPYFLGAVVLLSFLLLTVVFRSVLVPLKAAVLNLLGVGAAYGVLVVVFQWGWAADLIGVESTLPIVPFIPVFMFAILFGLSMDYEVFLLSRVREHYLRTGDNHAAVIQGIAGTARVITSAALIMIAVFGGFVLDDDPRDQDVRSRARDRDPRRRHGHSARARAGDDDAARRRELVAAALARPVDRRAPRGDDGRAVISVAIGGNHLHAPARNRTWNLRIKSPLLCQLSYRGAERRITLATGRASRSPSCSASFSCCPRASGWRLGRSPSPPEPAS